MGERRHAVYEAVIQKESVPVTAFREVVEKSNEMCQVLLVVENSDLLADLLVAIGVVKLKADALIEKTKEDEAIAVSTAEMLEKRDV